LVDEVTMHSAIIAKRLSLPSKKVNAAIDLFEDGATIPFVARYRKEKTGGLDEVQLRNISELILNLKEIDERRKTILKTLSKQGDLTEALRNKFLACQSKVELEDLYTPFKKSRKSKADIAKEKGLEPLATQIEKQPRNVDVSNLIKGYISANRGVPTSEIAWQGARDIVAERIAHQPKYRIQIRDILSQHGRLESKLNTKSKNHLDFKEYAGHSGRVASVTSHRYLALCRAEKQGGLRVKLVVDQSRTMQQLLRSCRYFPRSPLAQQFHCAVEDSLKRLLLPTAERAVRSFAKTKADEEAIDVFEKNLDALLMASPLGSKSVLGVDPGIRTGCKVAMVDKTGKFLAYQTIHLVGRNNAETTKLLNMIAKNRPQVIAIGNGTGGREAEKVVRSALKQIGNTNIQVVSVNEAGASIYSASDVARKELPNVDLTVRGAVSIARRLQDPLSELVKIDPKSIGVGQYQHDVDQSKLQRRLHQVVESCVNRVGVNLNTASETLLSYVAGIGPKMASSIVEHRSSNGRFDNRNSLKKVKGLGNKTYEQCAGFLRIQGGSNPLDSSAVHPESYSLVQRMAKDLKVSLQDLVGNQNLISKIEVEKYSDSKIGVASIKEIIDELEKPGRDPRKAFEAIKFRDDVHNIEDVESGMVLQGVVTNVTNFGAFVDIGVHQDGLIHISKLCNRRIATPHEVVTLGQRVQVRVLNVDIKKSRISLSSDL
jgi:protein Tex